MKEAYKCVIVADEALPAGVLANTAAILGMTLGSCVPESVGEDVADASGKLHRGITMLPVTVLKAGGDTLRTLREKLFSDEYAELICVDFSDVAQRNMVYSGYIEDAAGTPESDFVYLGLALWGSRKKINSLTGSLGLWR